MVSVIVGTSFVGTSSNESFAGSDGADTISNGGGRDTLQGGLGNDTFTFDAQHAGNSVFDGGADTDTLVIQNLPGAPTSASFIFPSGISSSQLSFIGSSLTGFEQLQFNSTAGTSVSVLFAFGGSGAPFNLSQIGTGLAANATITGGAGWDNITLVANYLVTATSSYALTAPSFT